MNVKLQTDDENNMKNIGTFVLYKGPTCICILHCLTGL